MFVKLDGNSFSNGKKIGRFSRKAIRDRIHAVCLLKKGKKIPDRLLDARIREFTRCIRSVAPCWLDEVQGMADGAGVKAEDILMLNCLPPGFYQPGGNNCTSFIIVRPDVIKLLKIRDERNLVQAFMIKDGRDTPAYQLGHDIGNIGIAHFFNQYCVAGATNTGSPSQDVEDKPALNDCHIMRFFAENAKRVADIPALYEELLHKKAVCGTNHERGSIFSGADPEKAILMETNMKTYSVEYPQENSVRVIANHFVTSEAVKWALRPPAQNSMRRFERMVSLLDQTGGNPSPEAVFKLTRDRKNIPNALCNDDRHHFWMSISAQLQVIERNAPEKSVNYICCGNPRHSLYLPVPIREKKNFIPLLNGDFYRKTDEFYSKSHCGKEFRTIQNRFEKKMMQREGDERIYQEAYDLISEISRNA